MPPKSSYLGGIWINDDDYPAARLRTREQRKNFTIYEDPDSHEDNEMAATSMARSPTDPDPDLGNPNAQSNTNAETIPGPQANLEHPEPDQETPNAEMIPGPEADIEHPVNNNVPETPSTFAAIGLEQMMLASSRRQPVASTTESFIRGDNDVDELDSLTSPSPANESALPDITRAGGSSAGRRSPGWNRRERLIHTTVYRNDTNERERTYQPPLIGEGHVGLTPIRNTRASPLFPTPAGPMPPPQTPASRMMSTRSAAYRLLRPTGDSPALVVRSTDNYRDQLNARSGVVRQLFRNPGTNLGSTPAPSNASEPQPVHPRTPHDPLRPSRLRSVSFTSALNEDTEMASPSVATPECQTGETRVAATECQTGETHVTTPQSQTGETPVITPEGQTGGTPPTPHTPHTPNTWISPSRVTPELVARLFTSRAYRNRDEPMEMTPSPPELESASPDDRKMEDAFWTPNKPGASLNAAGSQKKVAAAQNPAPTEYKAPIVNSASFGDAMAQDFASIQNVAPIENSTPVQDAMSPGTTRVRTVISAEITTTITKTPSPPQSPTPARRPTDKQIAATPHKTANAPRRQVASTPQRKGKGGVEQKTNRRRTADHIISGGINRRQELRTSPRYSLRDSTRGIMPGTYSLTPVRKKPFKAESAPKEK